MTTVLRRARKGLDVAKATWRRGILEEVAGGRRSVGGDAPGGSIEGSCVRTEMHTLSH